MKHFIKSTFLSFIVTTFIFSPQVMAKPSGPKVTEKRIKNVLSLVKKNRKKGVKVSQFVESTKPLLKRKIFKRLRKDSYPYWDKRMTKVAFGKNQVIVKYKNHVIAAKYVDKGPVAFIVNNKPLLWKDVIVYERMKKRMYEIMGIKGNTKVSFIDEFMKKLSSKAFAIITVANDSSEKETTCKDKNRKYVDGNCGGCVEGTHYPHHPRKEQFLIDEDKAGNTPCERIIRVPDPATIPVPPPKPETETETEQAIVKPTPEPAEEEEEFDKRGLIAFGIAALVILMLARKDKKKASSGSYSDPEAVPVSPAEVWTPEGACPTPGARGLTPADLPPECRANESCVNTNTCTSNEGSIDGTPTPIGF